MNVTDLIARLRGYHDGGVTIYSQAADALEAQAREIADLQAGWQRTYDHDVARLQERLAAAELDIERLQRNEAGHLNVICEQQRKLAAAERERDKAVRLLRKARTCLNVWNTDSDAVNHGCPCSACENTRTQRRIDAFLAADSATHRETPVT